MEFTEHGLTITIITLIKVIKVVKVITIKVKATEYS